MALITTAGASNAESYASVTEGETYWVAHGNPAEWDEATTLEIEAALRYATQYLEQNFTWHSTIYDVTQSLGWPRRAYLDAEGRDVGGDGVIPQKIKDATCELALQHLKEGFNDSTTENIQSERIGSASVTYKASSSKTYPFLRMMLKDYGFADKGVNASLWRG